MHYSIGIGIITLNEEKNISSCLKSVSFADEIVVIDSESTDKTVEIAKELGANVIVNPWPGYAKQKQMTLDKLNTDFKLILDADEYLTEKAQIEIQELMKNTKLCNGYFLPRYLIFMGRTHFYGKGRDKQLRLIRSGCGKFDDRNIHEQLIVTGSIGDLQNGALHNSSESITARIKKMKRDISMEMINDDFIPVKIKDITIVPFYYFCAYLFKYKAYRDGIPGIIILTLATLQLVFLKLALIRKRSKEN